MGVLDVPCTFVSLPELFDCAVLSVTLELSTALSESVLSFSKNSLGSRLI